MTTRRRRVAELLGLFRDLDDMVRQVSGKSVSAHVEEWWQTSGRPYIEQMLLDGGPRGLMVDPLEADYALFGLTPECSDEVLRYAYHNLMKEHHPDKRGQKEDAARINDAYGRLEEARSKARRR